MKMPSSSVPPPRSSVSIQSARSHAPLLGTLASTLPASNDSASSLAVRLARSLTDTVTGSTVAIVVARDAAANVSAMYLGYDVAF